MAYSNPYRRLNRIIRVLSPTCRNCRSFLIGLLGLTEVSATAIAAEKRHVIVQETMTLPLVQSTTEWFRKEIVSLGYADGGSISYRVVNTEGNADTAKQLLSSAIRQEAPSMVVSIATLASRALRQLLNDGETPQVFAIVTDPVGEGFVPTVGKAGASNVTGRTHVVPAAAKLQVVAQSIAALSENAPFRIALLRSSYPSPQSDAKQLLQQVHNYPGIALVELPYDYIPGEAGRETMHKAAIPLLKKNSARIDGVWLATGPNEHNSDFVRDVLATGKTIVCANNKKAVHAGALLCLVSTAEINGRSIAALADAIFKGTPAGEIPVTRPDSFSVGLNVATATKLGIVIPSHIVELAEGNIVR